MDISTDRAVRWATTATVIGVAAVAAYVSYQHAYELVSTHGETGLTARLVPLTIDGMIFSSSMVLLDAARNQQPVPKLARILLALGIVASIAANVMHGIDHGIVGALVAATPAVTLIGCYELLMKLIRGSAADALEGPVVADPHPLREHALQVFHGALEAGQVPSIRQLRKKLSIGHPKAKDLHADLAALARSQTPEPVDG